MGTLLNNKIGLAGEFRVMSELLLRGHNPAKSYLNEGADIILENGLRVEVKSAHRLYQYWRGGRTKKNYLFKVRGGKRQRPLSFLKCDFVVFWCIDDDCFLIIPKLKITGTAVSLCNISNNSRSKYIQYKNKWDLLEDNNG